MAQQRSPPYLDCQVGSATTDANGNATVTFKRGFSGIPKVFLQGVDSSYRGIVLDVVSKTAAGFAAKARKVTGITSGAGGVDHTHGVSYYTDTFVTGGTKYTGAFVTGGTKSTGTFVTGGTDPLHAHGPGTLATGIPSAHGTLNIVTTPTYKYVASTSGGSPTYGCYVGTTWDAADLPTGTHTHAVAIGNTGGSTTGITFYTASAMTDLTLSTASAMTDLTFSAASAVTSISDTGGASAYSHQHSVDAPVLSVNFDWLCILV